MTAKQDANQIDDSLFDSFDDTQADTAIHAIAQSSTVKRIIVEQDKSFIGRFSDGTRIRIPLRISLDMVNKISEKSDDPVDQLTTLIEGIAGKDEAAKFTAAPVNEAAAMARLYFDDLQKLAGASMGE